MATILPALPKVSPERWRQEYTGCSTVLAITLTELVLVHVNGWADAAANGAFTQLHGALMLAVDGLAVLALLLLANLLIPSLAKIVLVLFNHAYEHVHILTLCVTQLRSLVFALNLL